MNKFIRTTLTAILITAIAVITNSSCKKQFDAPPAYVAPNITANTTIRQLKATHAVAGKIDNITSDIIIKGIVIGDDKSGNLYKSLVIQDESGGILIRLDGNSLYTIYPIGQEVFIKCKGLFLGDYNNLIQLGGGADVTVTPASLLTIPTALFSQYIVKGSAGNVVTPKLVTVSQLGTTMQDTLQNVLIKLSNFEFAAADTSKTYANATTNPPGTANFVLKNCNGNTVTLRNSGFADFAAIGIPNGNGSIVSIYTVFGSTKQLTIRDTSDLQMYDARCGSGGGVTPPPVGGILLSENFESQVVPTAAPFNPISITNWTNLDEVGGKKYDSRIFLNNKYAQLSAFGSAQAAVTSWLVTKAIDLGTNTTKTLTFGTSGGFNNGATLKVLVSSNFIGTGNPWATGVTWMDITSSATLCTIPSTGYFSGFTPSGNVSLNSFTGTIYIAFKYEGADAAGTASDKTTTWQIDNIVVTGN